MYSRIKTRSHVSGLYLLLFVALAMGLGLPQGLVSGIQTAGGLQLPAVVDLVNTEQRSEATVDPVGVLDTQEQRLPARVSDDWWSAVQEDIRRSEYQVSWQDNPDLPGLMTGYQAPNRAQGLRTYFTPQVIRVVPNTERAPSWEWGLRLSKWGYAGALQPVEEALMVVEANRVEYQRGALTEWYLNDERGLEQGFALNSPPDSGRSAFSTWVVLEMDLIGDLNPVLDASAGIIDFTTKGGVRVLRYSQLLAFDALGEVLPARFVLEGEAIAILVNTSDAVYPLTIDPLASTPSWTAEGDQEGAHFGYSVGTAGDVNGDGYADVIIGASHYGNGEINEGQVFVYHGGSSGLTPGAAWTGEGGQANANFGYSVGTAGDVNGDGYADVIIGAPNYENEENYAGQAAVYLGSSSGLSDSPVWTMEGDQYEAYFGWSVGTAGDVNGDGYADVIVGAYGYSNGQTYEGRVYVYHGGKSGLSASSAWTAEGEQAGAFFGYSVGTAGDVNGDGYADVIIGAPYYTDSEDDNGQASVYHGSAMGLSEKPVWTVDGDQVSAYQFGRTVGMAGDVNGDGFADVIVGAQYADNGKSRLGRAFVYHGSFSGLNADPNWTAEGEYAFVDFGKSVGTAGDVNGDGYADVIVGAYGFNNEVTGKGSASVYHGGASGLSLIPDWVVSGEQERANFGHSVGMAGDVNGDGYADVIIGAPYHNNGEASEGLAFVYHGSAGGLSAYQKWAAEGDKVNASFGYSVGTAGDVNGDSFADVIIGAPYYDDGEDKEGRVFVYHGSAAGLSSLPDWKVGSDQVGVRIGWSVSTAGDVNGDGYADVIVGAPRYTDGDQSEGRVYVYQGSPTGLSVSPVWTVEGGQANANFGYSVGTAGDVNGDGYADVIVGAPFHNHGENNEGKAYVYQGGAAGLSASPAWTAESNQEYAYFGRSVGTAGDVNGDGYADVIVGADGYTTDGPYEGRAYVYHGGISGLSGSPAWTVEGDQTGAQFGYSVGTAGDVNGDSYADVIVGAPMYDYEADVERQAFVYHGSAAGLSISPSWVADGDQGEGYFGYSVGTAGDVNGDGYADVIVGDPNYGEVDERQVHVYHGGASRLSGSPEWTAKEDHADAYFGDSVGTAGDVNGDGFADVIVGAPGYSNMKEQEDEGRAYVYYGNAGGGRLVLARQVQPDGTPVQPWGLSGTADGLQVRVQASHPMGRGRVKLQVQACPAGEAFAGTACLIHTAADWTDTSTAADGVTLIETVNGLQADTLYRWRARLLYAPQTVTEAGIIPPPNPAHGPWLRYLGGSQEADLRTNLAPDPVSGDEVIYLPLIRR
jgi:hypothetical protein